MSEGAVHPLPPPWGPALDPHFRPKFANEGRGYHYQVTAEEAAKKGWFYRSEWYKCLVPDTRRCAKHGEIMFEAAELTEAQISDLYRFQNNGMATGPIG